MDEIHIKDKEINRLNKKLKELEGDKAENIKSFKLLKIQLERDCEDKIRKNNDEIKSFKQNIQKEFRVLEKIDKRKEGYIEALSKELIMAKQIIKQPKLLKKYTRDMNFIIKKNVNLSRESLSMLRCSKERRAIDLLDKTNGATSRSNRQEELEMLKPMSSYVSVRYSSQLNSHSRTKTSSKYEFDPVNHTVKLLDTPRIEVRLAKHK